MRRQVSNASILDFRIRLSFFLSKPGTMQSCGLFIKIDRFDALVHFLLNFIVFTRIKIILLFNEHEKGFKTQSREWAIRQLGIAANARPRLKSPLEFNIF
jgi:hypothetical protein